MNYLDSVKLFREIERDYDVMSIRYKGISVWPYLRIYLFDELTAHLATGYTSSALKVLLTSLFRFNPLCFFRKYQVWDYSSSTTRKKVGDIYEHHVSGYLHKCSYSVLTIEFQSPGIKVISRKEIPERNIVSGSWTLALNAFLELIMRPFHQDIEGEDILIDIINKLGLKLDYKKRLRWLVAQKRATDFFLALAHKPELIIMECSYTQMGRVWAAHNHGIPVIELQHGVLNANHYAYNPTYHSPVLYPDEICVYGEVEYDYFLHQEKGFAERVSMTGLYILDRCSKHFKEDLFNEIRSKYQKVVVVAGQVGGEEKLSSFVDKLAEKLPDSYFIYIPRHIVNLQLKSPNVELKMGVNIYEYLKWCDYHVTISSTTALEAHYFKKPVVFCDFEGRAIEYYGNIIRKENGAFYVHSIEEYLEVEPELFNTTFTYRELFAHDSEKRMQSVLERYLGNEKI